jgi:endonuclease YncB( thermonuclease family)
LAVWKVPRQCSLVLLVKDLFNFDFKDVGAAVVGEGQAPVFISPRNRVAQLYPRALGSLSVASYDSQGLWWKFSYPPRNISDQGRERRKTKLVATQSHITLLHEVNFLYN